MSPPKNIVLFCFVLKIRADLAFPLFSGSSLFPGLPQGSPQAFSLPHPSDILLSDFSGGKDKPHKLTCRNSAPSFLTRLYLYPHNQTDSLLGTPIIHRGAVICGTCKDARAAKRWWSLPPVALVRQSLEKNFGDCPTFIGLYTFWEVINHDQWGH